MSKINYIKGDATRPTGIGNKIIVHVCNDIGGWGKGFVVAISKRWKAPEKQFRDWFASGEGFDLGEVQFVKVEDDLWIANLIGQHKIRRNGSGKPPVRYEAIESGLEKVSIKALELGASIHMPRIGCGLAGGKWEMIESIIDKTLSKKSIEVTVYDFY